MPARFFCSAKRTIGETETAPELMQRLSVTGADLLSETLAQIDDITPRPQRDHEATFAPVLTKADGAINWLNPASTIERCVRGFQPWPTAYTQHAGRRLIVWKAAVVESGVVEETSQPGQVVVADGDTPGGFIVAIKRCCACWKYSQRPSAA